MKGITMDNDKHINLRPRQYPFQGKYALAFLLCILLAGCGTSADTLPVAMDGQSDPTSTGLLDQAMQPIVVPGEEAAQEMVVSHLPDADMDGIPDEIEIILGTDPNFLDTDWDGLTDHWELWGVKGYPLGQIGDMGNLTDPNGNGIIAPLDQGDMGDQVLKQASQLLYRERVPVTMPEEGSMLPNDVDGDGIPNDFELFGFYFEIAEDNQPYFVRWPWWTDLYELDITYFKTDPTQWSSDGDPFSDWEEATKINLDQRIKTPGDHPCIPAYPKIEAFLTSYTVELAEKDTIESASGGKVKNKWSKGTTSIISSKSSYFGGGLSVDAKIGIFLEATTGTSINGAGPAIEAIKKPKGSTLFHARTEVMALGFYNNESVTGNLAGGAAKAFDSTSGIAGEKWSTAKTVATNTAQAAQLTLNLKIINTGTLPATNAEVLFNLYIGDMGITSFVVNLTEFGELMPMAENPLELAVSDDGRVTKKYPTGAPIMLSMDQLRSLESGAPLAIEAVGFEADTLVWEIDPDTGRRTFLKMGPWSPYWNAIQNSTARVVIDLSNDPTYAPIPVNGLPSRGLAEVRVFCHSPYSNYSGSPPNITLTDAFVWAFGAQNTEQGPTVTIRDPISRTKHSTTITGWKFAFDKLTLDKIMADPDYMTGIFTLPLEPSNPGERVYTCEAPPQGERANPRIYWSSCNPETRKIRSYSRDVRGLKEMRFKPDPEADYDGELMRMGFDPEDPAQEFAYTYELPSQYKWTGFEQVVAVNRAGKQTVMNIEVVGNELGSQVDGDTFGVGWDGTGVYSQSFSFNEGVVTNPPFDLVFSQEFTGNDLTLTLSPINGGALHDALYVLDPDPYGTPPQYLLDYNYLRKQVFDLVQIMNENIFEDSSAEPPLTKTYAIRSQTGRLAVFKPELVSVPLGGGQYKYQVGSIVWRTYEGI